MSDKISWGKGICATCEHKHGKIYFSCSDYRLIDKYNHDSDTCGNYKKENLKISN